MKNIKTFIATFLLLSAFVQPLFAQSKEQLLKDWERAKDYTKDYLEAMPEAKYSFKPTPEIRSFAQQMLHLADTNCRFATAISGKDSPIGTKLEKNADPSKANVTKLVLASYDFIIDTIKSQTETQLENDIATLFGKLKMTKVIALDKCFEHQTHHRGQATIYLRLAGVKPPKEKLF